MLKPRECLMKNAAAKFQGETGIFIYSLTMAPSRLVTAVKTSTYIPGAGCWYQRELYGPIVKDLYDCVLCPAWYRPEGSAQGLTFVSPALKIPWGRSNTLGGIILGGSICQKHLNANVLAARDKSWG